MQIYIPWTYVQSATEIALKEYGPTFVGLRDDYTYSDYWQDRWLEDIGFINVEHDVVPWPGAIESLEQCPEPWCMYDYHLRCHWQFGPDEKADGAPPVGCVKISSELIQKTRTCWSQPVPWYQCDVHLDRVARAAGFVPHRHSPNVVNANPAFLGM